MGVAMKQIQTYDKLVLSVDDIVAFQCSLLLFIKEGKRRKAKKEVVC